MDIRSAQRIAQGEMFAHGLTQRGWTFAWDRAKQRNGQCDHMAKRITMSSVIVPLTSEEHVRNTILHEIAHALVGPGHGHDSVWRAKHIALGGTGERCGATLDLDAHIAISKWRIVCSTHGETLGHVQRRGKRLLRSVCREHKSPLMFVENT